MVEELWGIARIVCTNVKDGPILEGTCTKRITSSIKEIHDSPTHYLANATFGTCLASQMREEMRLELNFFLHFGP